MKTNFKFLSLMVGLVLAFSTAAFGQFQTGTIEGTVTDPTGKVVAGATVTLKDNKTGTSQTATTSDAGIYRFGSLVPGDYSLTIEGAGFAKANVERVSVQVGLVAHADVQMKVGGASETVNVDIGDTAVQVDTTRQTVDGVITAKQIVNMPLNERNFLELAGLQPGVTVVDGGVIDPTKSNTFRAVRVNGGSGTGTRVQIEGIDVTDETVGTTVANFSTDAVQEFNLARSSFDLSTSLTTSGAVSIASRTGGNDFNGSAFWFLQRDKFDARPGFAGEKPDFKRDQYGYRVGGPIVKNRLFFFSNAERFKQADFSDFASADFPAFNRESVLPIKTFNTMQRADFHATDKIRFFYLFNHSDDISTGGSLVSPFDNIDWTNTHVIGVNISGANVTHSIRLGYVNFNNKISSNQLDVFSFPTGPSGTPLQINTGDLSAGPNSLAPQQTYQDNKQFKYDGSWVAGSHVIRFGGELNKILLGGFANFAGPMTVISDIDDLQGPNANDPLDYALVDFVVGPANGFFTALPAHNLPFGGKKDNRIAFYGGDNWRIRPNFSLNFGVRWNYDTNFFANSGTPHLASIDLYGAGIGNNAKYPKNAFSPQLGFAWDPWKDGKTSIRGGFYLAYEANIFNNALFDEFARLHTGIGPTFFGADSVKGPTGAPIVVAGTPCPQAQVNVGNYSCLIGMRTSTVVPYVDAINTALQAVYAAGFANYDPNGTPSEFDLNRGVTFGGQFPGDYQIPYSMQFNIGFQREIARNHVLSVDYVRQRGVGLPYQLRDYEARADSRFFNAAAAATRINTFLDGSAATSCRPGQSMTINQAISIGCLQPAADPKDPPTFFFPSISNFGLTSEAVWTGVTPQNLRARLVVGGFSLYRGLQVSMNGRFGSEKFEHAKIAGESILRGLNYTISYALSRNESTGGGGRPEFIANTQDNRNYNSNFGPNGLDRTHNLGVSLGMDLIGGFRLDTVFKFQTAPPLSIFIPNNRSTAGIFTSDFNGDGGTGSSTSFPTPRADLLPGTNIGDFGRRIKNIAALNQYIIRYNNDFAGKLTPHGQRLVDAGLFTFDQMVALGATLPVISLIDPNTPDPFESRTSTDVRFSRPIKFGSERFVLEPSISIFNVFNNSPRGTFTGLALPSVCTASNAAADPSNCPNGPTGQTGLNVTNFGSLNYIYDSSEIGDLDEFRTLINKRRQMQFGIRFTF